MHWQDDGLGLNWIVAFENDVEEQVKGEDKDFHIM